MQLGAYIAKFAANSSGSFGYLMTSKQCGGQRPLNRQRHDSIKYR